MKRRRASASAIKTKQVETDRRGRESAIQRVNAEMRRRDAKKEDISLEDIPGGYGERAHPYHFIAERTGSDLMRILDRLQSDLREAVFNYLPNHSHLKPELSEILSSLGALVEVTTQSRSIPASIKSEQIGHLKWIIAAASRAFVCVDEAVSVEKAKAAARMRKMKETHDEAMEREVWDIVKIIAVERNLVIATSEKFGDRIRDEVRRRLAERGMDISSDYPSASTIKRVIGRNRGQSLKVDPHEGQD